MRVAAGITYLLTGLVTFWQSVAISLALVGLAEPSVWWYGTLWSLLMVGAPLALIAAGVCTLLKSEFNARKALILALGVGALNAYLLVRMGPGSGRYISPLLLASLITIFLMCLVRRPTRLALMGSLIIGLIYLFPLLHLVKGYVLIQRIPLQSLTELNLLIPGLLICLSLYFCLRNLIAVSRQVQTD